MSRTRSRSSPVKILKPEDLPPAELARLQQPKENDTRKPVMPRPGLVSAAFTEPKVEAIQKPKTMADFWIEQGWYKEAKAGDSKAIFAIGIGHVKLTKAKWQDDENVRIEAIKFLVEEVLNKDPRDITTEDFHSNRLAGLPSHYYNGSPYAALKEADLVTEKDEVYMCSSHHTH